MYRGELVSKEKLLDIANNYKLTKHAKERLLQRATFNNSISNMIINSVLAYYNTDGSINIAINEYEYFVVDSRSNTVITFKEKSLNSVTIYEKRKLAQKGIDRR